jgi:hypothetical protein
MFRKIFADVFVVSMPNLKLIYGSCGTLDSFLICYMMMLPPRSLDGFSFLITEVCCVPDVDAFC